MKELLLKLEENDIHLKLVNAELSIKFPKAGIDKALLEEIRLKKADLVSYLSGLSGAAAAGIPAIEQQVDYELSSAQKRLWIVSQFEDSNIAYNIPGSYLFEGPVHLDALKQSLETIIHRHEILRTVFKEDASGNVRQVITAAESWRFELPVEDLSREASQQERTRAIIRTEIETPFDLANGPLFRLKLLKLSDDKHLLSYVFHHIIFDAWSLKVLKKELTTLYAAFCTQQANPLPVPGIHYKDYAAWQQTQLGSERTNEHKNYWFSQFEGEIPVLALPSDKVRPAVKTYNGGMVVKTLSATVSNGMKELSRTQGITLFMAMLAGVKALLYRYTGQNDLVTGTAISGREHADLENQIGFYLNILALRTQFSENSSFTELAEAVKKTTLGGYQHQAYPFDMLLDDLSLKRDISRSPLFDVMVDLLSTEGGSTAKTKENRFYEDVSVISRFDLTFYFADHGDRLDMTLEYNNDIYSRTFVERLCDHLEQLLAAAIAAPNKPIKDLAYLSSDETVQLLNTFNNTAAGYPRNKTLAELFEAQAAATPHAAALVCNEKTISYAALNERANQLASYLKKHYSLAPGTIAGIRLDHSEHTITAILGVLKTGAAYLPIDTSAPEERVAYILSNSRCKLVIDEDELEAFNAERSRHSKTDPPATATASDAAYVIYTSGSTGQPKGVVVAHRSAVNYIYFAANAYSAGGTAFPLITSLSFDLTVTSIYTPLLTGGSLHIYERGLAMPDLLKACLDKDSGIETMKITPAHVNLIAGLELSATQVKQIIVGGEELSAYHVAVLKKLNPALRIFNEYGPTETTVGSVVWEAATGAGKILIGKPIANTSIYIVDASQALLPVGAIGELCIGGEGLALGYLGNEALTNEKFVKDPFAKSGRLYKTGDLAKWLPDGNIEFVGRKDGQVKINGYRIELGEIEAALRSYENMEAAFVLVQNDNNNKTLVAYVVSSQALNTSDLYAWLSTRLPAYMIPSHFIQLSALPLTSNGKVDKKMLPELSSEGTLSGSGYTAPQTALEMQLAGIWQEALNRPKIGITDNFFESGGDSIKILKVISAMRKQLDLDLPLGILYKHNTIKHLASFIAQNENDLGLGKTSRIESENMARQQIEALKERILASGKLKNAANIEDIYPMSAIEIGMLYESLLQKGVYHDQMVHHKTFVDFNLHTFTQALSLMMQKHAILRTVFNISDFERDVQIVLKKAELPLYYEDLLHLAADAQKERTTAYLAEELDKPFNYTEEPLWRMSVLKLSSSFFVFIFQCHHAIIDGWSDAAFNTELNNLYLKLRQDPLFIPSALTSGYKDHVIELEADRQNGAVKQFWQNELTGYTRPDLFTGEVKPAALGRAADSQFIKKLEAAALHHNTTVKALSLSAYLHMLHVLSYDSNIITGLVTNTRPKTEDSEQILGCFLNTIPLRLTVTGAENGYELVKKVHSKLIDLKDNERFSLVEMTQLFKNVAGAGNPFFDIYFNYVDFHVYDGIEAQAKEEEAVPAENGDRSVVLARGHTTLEFHIATTGGSYVASLSATRSLKCGFALNQLLDLYFSILTHIVEAPQQTVGAAPYVSQQELKQLHAFNNNGLPLGNKTLVQLFEERAQNTPDNTALLYDDLSLTYTELNELSNCVADYLRKNCQVKPDDRIGIMLDRTEWLIIVMLGVLKSGAAYVPVDTAYPAERIHYIIEDSQCKLLIDQQKLDAFKKEMSLYSRKNLPAVNQLSDMAYVIYTSGSTGKPKGVMIEHSSASAFIDWCDAEFGKSPYDIVFAVTSICFDLSVFEIFYTLISGKRLRLLNNALAVTGYLHTEKRILLNTVPSAVGALLNESADFSNISVLNMAGEPIPERHIAQLDYARIEIRNLYGPSEDTTYSTIYRINSPENILIGRPIANTQVYIVNSSNGLAPIGVPGEICISGKGLARGYLNRPELTAEKFVMNPFAAGERLYRTGDLGRWLPDGNIEFFGRRDDQVKVRGYRIELGEIEKALQAYEKIEAAVVVARPNASGEKSLVAYLVSHEALQVADLRAHLKLSLPDYMIPERFVQLDALPLTNSGKTDKNALPDPQTLQLSAGSDFVAPGNDTEADLCRIWKEVLEVEQVGIHDNFFELGGNSIKAIRLFKRINDIYPAVQVASLYSHPTVQGIANLIAPQTVTQKETKITNLEF